MIPGGIQDGPNSDRPRSIDQAFEAARMADPRPVGNPEVLSYEASVYKIQEEDSPEHDYWMVVVHDRRTGQTLTRTYLGWSPSSPEGMFADQALTNLIEVAALSAPPVSPPVPADEAPTSVAARCSFGRCHCDGRCGLRA